MAYRNYLPEPQYYAPIKVERKTPGRNLFDYLGPITNALSTWQSGNLKSKMFEHQMAQQQQARTDRLARQEIQDQRHAEQILRADAARDEGRRRWQATHDATQAHRDYGIAQALEAKQKLGQGNQLLAEFLGSKTENPLRETWDLGLDYGDDMMSQPDASSFDQSKLVEAVKQGAIKPGAAIELWGKVHSGSSPTLSSAYTGLDSDAMKDIREFNTDYATQTGYITQAYTEPMMNMYDAAFQDGKELGLDTSIHRGGLIQGLDEVAGHAVPFWTSGSAEARKDIHSKYGSQIRDILSSVSKKHIYDEEVKTGLEKHFQDFLNKAMASSEAGYAGGSIGGGSVSEPELAGYVQQLRKYVEGADVAGKAPGRTTPEAYRAKLQQEAELAHLVNKAKSGDGKAW